MCAVYPLYKWNIDILDHHLKIPHQEVTDESTGEADTGEADSIGTVHEDGKLFWLLNF